MKGTQNEQRIWDSGKSWKIFSIRQDFTEKKGQYCVSVRYFSQDEEKNSEIEQDYNKGGTGVFWIFLLSKFYLTIRKLKEFKVINMEKYINV